MTPDPSMPGKLLLAVDGSVHSERACRYLAACAVANPGGEVYMLHVSAPGTGSGTGFTEQELELTAAARRVLDLAGIPYSWRVASGDPAETIARIATEQEVDEIIMGSRGLGRWKGLALGSVAQRVIEIADQPVTVAGTESQSGGQTALAEASVHRILLPVDGSGHSLRAVEYVCQLNAAGMPLEVELLNVVGPIPPGYLHEFLTPEKLDFYYQQEGAKALFEARANLKAAGVRHNLHVVAGNVADTMTRMAVARNCTRIVMGRRGQGSLAAMVLGSTAYQALHCSPVPVTLVK